MRKQVLQATGRTAHPGKTFLCHAGSGEPRPVPDTGHVEETASRRSRTLLPAHPIPVLQSSQDNLFQYNHRHLTDGAITACLRFLLHGMVFKTREGHSVVLIAHLLRHTFATHAVQVEKIPVDIVGAWLKQKNLDVTDSYSQPTESMVAAAADQFLAHIAAHSNVSEAVRRSPEEMRRLYQEARGKAGTLADVKGGDTR